MRKSCTDSCVWLVILFILLAQGVHAKEDGMASTAKQESVKLQAAAISIGRAGEKQQNEEFTKDCRRFLHL